MATRPRILWCSQTPSIHTGYGIITHDILERLHATGKYEIACHGWHEPAAPNPRYPFEALGGPGVPYKLFHAGNVRPEEPNLHEKMGKKNFHEIVEHFRPDVVIMYGDTYMFDYVFDHPDRNKFHLGIYVAIDGAPVPNGWANSFKRADTVVTFSKFAVKAIKDRAGIDAILIPHGIDYPMWSMPLPGETVKNKKRELFNTSEDIFVFGMVARNQPRKNIPAFYEAFAAHSKNHPNSRMLLHSVNKDQGWELNLLAHEFSIKDKIFIPANITPQHGISNKDLRLVYNCMDIHVNTAWGEGFGIPIIESMACGVPNIAPAYTTGPEFIDENKAGITVRPATFTVEPISHIRRCIVDPGHLLKAMDFMYENRPSVKNYGRNAKTATAKYDWPQVIPLWEQAIDKMVSEKAEDYIDMERI